MKAAFIKNLGDFMLNAIINYTIRGLVIIVGLVLVFGLIDIPEDLRSMAMPIGVVAIIFGVYRMVMFYSQNKRYKSYIDNRDNELGK
jgi:uncharacterized membrane protein